MVFGRKELRDWLVFFVGIGAVYYAVYGDVKYGLKLFARTLFGGVCLAIAYQVALLLLRKRTLWRAATSAAAAAAAAADAHRDENKEAEYRRQQGDRTSQLQQQADREGKEYAERVLEPRRLRELEEAEKEYYRFTSGRPFAGLGHALGGFDDANDRDAGSERGAPRGDGEQDEASAGAFSAAAAASAPGDGGTAAYRRRLLVGELATSSNASRAALSTSQIGTPTSTVDATVPPRPREARKCAAQLPAEPSVDDPTAVTVGFRTPTGQTHRRRFHRSDRLVVLYDYLSTLGYDDATYVLAMSFPRRLIESQADVEISAAGLERAVLLNVEARDV